MLRGLNPLLSGDLLKVLDEMGHGDTLAVVDRNYPATSSGRPVLRMGDVTVTRALEAIVSVFPLDTFVDHPAERMEVDDDPGRSAAVQDAALDVLRAAHSGDLEWGVVPRLDFYRRAHETSAVVHTLEARPWGCFILRKGVIFPDDPSEAPTRP